MSGIAVSMAAMVVALARGPDGGIIVTPGDPYGHVGAPTVDLGAISGHQPGRPGGTPGFESGTGVVPGCVYVPMEASADELWDSAGEEHLGTFPSGNSTTAYSVVCDGAYTGWILGPPPDGAASGPLATPESLAQQAYEQLVLPPPMPKHSPDFTLSADRSATVLGEQMWLWTANEVWAPQRRRVQVGTVWAEAVATPIQLTFESGTGDGVTCSGPGTPYSASAPLHAPSPDCGYVYRQPAEVTTRFSITWSVSWTGAIGSVPANGVLPNLVSSAEKNLSVIEIQALNER